MKRLLCFFGFHKWIFDYCEKEKGEWTTQHYHCLVCKDKRTKPYGPEIDWYGHS